MLSIIIPAYNAESSIEKCVKSVLEQKFRDYELIIIDDGSTDGTSVICDEYAKKDARVKVIHQDNIGLIASRNKGVLLAQNELIGFVDADDWIEPEYFETLLNQMGKKDIVSSGVIRVYKNEDNKEKKELNSIEAGIYESPNQLEKIYGKMLCNRIPFEFGILPFMWNKIFKKDLIIPILEKVNKTIFDGEDVAIVFPYMLKAKSIVLSDYCGYHYMIHDKSMSQKKRTLEYYNEACLYKWLYEQFMESEYKDIIISQLNRYMLMMLWKRNPESYIDANKFIFPVECIPYNSRIIIYGAGDVGKAYIKQIEQNHYCNIVACADQKFLKSEEKNDIRYINPDSIKKEQFDYILIAINNKNLSNYIRCFLKKTVFQKKKSRKP